MYPFTHICWNTILRSRRQIAGRSWAKQNIRLQWTPTSYYKESGEMPSTIFTESKYETITQISLLFVVCNSVKWYWCSSYLPVFVMIISVPRELNLDQRSLFSRVIFRFLSIPSLCGPPSILLWSLWPEKDGYPPNCWLWPTEIIIKLGLQKFFLHFYELISVARFEKVLFAKCGKRMPRAACACAGWSWHSLSACLIIVTSPNCKSPD